MLTENSNYFAENRATQVFAVSISLFRHASNELYIIERLTSGKQQDFSSFTPKKHAEHVDSAIGIITENNKFYITMMVEEFKEKSISKDLSEIKKLYPDFKKSVDDLCKFFEIDLDKGMFR